MTENIPLVGRTKEQAILKETLTSLGAEMVAVIGRRRVGKTFLINTVFGNQIAFELTGIQDTPLQKQLKNFKFVMGEATGEISEKPADWMDAFIQLIQFLKTKQSEEKLVVFFDELPWLATRRSGFLQALSFFWNSWAVKQNIVVVICGSAASWMIQKVVNHRGGLHNRITKLIHLQPFNLTETELYLRSKNIQLDRYQIVQIYMAMGGVPHYLKEIERGKSAVQNINNICFSSTGLLRKEFSRLYPALFENAENHIAVIRTLANAPNGMRRKAIIKATQLTDGGGIKKVLDELENSGFISEYYAFGKKKQGLIYRLTDEYSLFYLKFIEPKKTLENDIWQQLSQTQSYISWSGYAFENLCLKHISEIKNAIGVSKIETRATSFYQPAKDGIPGVQIDLVIDRKDHVISLFEIKFYNVPFVPTKEFANKLRMKAAIFKAKTKTNKQLFINLITTFSIIPNEHSIGLIDEVLTLDSLFEK